MTHCSETSRRERPRAVVLERWRKVLKQKLSFDLCLKRPQILLQDKLSETCRELLLQILQYTLRSQHLSKAFIAYQKLLLHSTDLSTSNNSFRWPYAHHCSCTSPWLPKHLLVAFPWSIATLHLRLFSPHAQQENIQWRLQALCCPCSWQQGTRCNARGFLDFPWCS